MTLPTEASEAEASSRMYDMYNVVILIKLGYTTRDINTSMNIICY